MQQVEKTITNGIDISPKMAGTWRWVSDKDLEFTPKNDWPIDKAFTVSFARAPVGRYIYVVTPDGVEGIGGYQMFAVTADRQH